MKKLIDFKEIVLCWKVILSPSEGIKSIQNQENKKELVTFSVVLATLHFKGVYTNTCKEYIYCAPK